MLSIKMHLHPSVLRTIVPPTLHCDTSSSSEMGYKISRVVANIGVSFKTDALKLSPDSVVPKTTDRAGMARGSGVSKVTVATPKEFPPFSYTSRASENELKLKAFMISA
jgi:hypothetical protein